MPKLPPFSFLAFVVIILNLSPLCIGQDLANESEALKVSMQDIPNSVVVSKRTGAIYVTGGSQASKSSWDYVTIKYDSSGDKQWLVRYNGSGNAEDIAKEIAIDMFDNVYITGISKAIEMKFDYTTIKYNADGEEQWVNRYSGPFYKNSSEAHYIGLAIAIDDSANVYSTGENVTIKYSSDGVLKWKHDNGGTDITIDDSANIITTGGSSFYVTKYSRNGLNEWSQSYKGSKKAYSSSRSLAIAVDKTGSTYAVGYTDGLGSAIFGKALLDQYELVKFGTNGLILWARHYRSYAHPNWATSIAIDYSNNIYVTGFSDEGEGKENDIVTIKYTSSGELKWISRYNGPANLKDEPKDIETDGAGNIFVTGYSSNLPETHYDFVTIKYSPSGQQKWIKNFNGPANLDDVAMKLDVDQHGNIYVIGYSNGGESDLDYVIIKYANSGKEQWIRRYDNG